MGRSLAFTLILITGVGIAAADCPDPTNLVGNCGFEVDLAGWYSPGGPSALLVRTTEDAHSGAASLALSPVVPVQKAHARSACMEISPQTTYRWGAFFRLSASSTGSPDYCRTELELWTDTTCSSAGYGSLTPPMINPGPTAWLKERRTYDNATTWVSARINIFCYSANPATEYTVLIDDVYLGVGDVPVELQAFSVE